jgi:hypothetical protein
MIHTADLLGNVRLEVSQSAIEQVADEPSALQAPRIEIERALQVSESGKAIGRVMEVCSM